MLDKHLSAAIFMAAGVSCGAAIAQDSIDYILPPQDGYLKFRAGFETVSYDLSISGDMAPQVSDRSGNACAGFVTAGPQYDVYFENDETASLSFAIDIVASVDTVLMVTGPDGGWDCVDDYDGTNPSLEYPAAPTGLYSIWVGTIKQRDIPLTGSITFSNHKS